MSKLYFRYGAMGSSKTANALMTNFNYLEKGRKSVILKPRIETRDGELVVKSRIGLEKECEILEDFLEKDIEEVAHYDAIIVDEAQFATKEQIDKLSDYVDFLDINVFCYGLRADFRNEFFEGSKRLMEIADEIEEIKTICWCGEKATCNVRYNENGEMIKEGEQVELGANDKYVSVCRKHFKEGKPFGHR